MTAAKDTARRLRRLAERLSSVADAVQRGSASRADLDAIVSELRTLMAQHFGPRQRAAHGEGAQGKILEHLQTNVGRWVEGDEVAAVSGIQEWARRVRELRVEQGYNIEERDGRYRLKRLTPQAAVADKWRSANSIRRREGSGRDRILAFLK